MVRKQTGRAENLPMFAQPVPSGAAQIASGAKPAYIRPLALIGLPIVLGGLLLASARPNGAQNRPAGSASASVAVVSPTVVSDLAQAPDKPRHDLSYYTQDVRSNLFSAPLPPLPKPPPPVKVKPAPKLPELPVEVPVAPVDPFADYSYTGTVTIGNETQALIENTKKGEGDYVKVGDSFQGATVTSLTDQMVTLKLGNKITSLAKSDNIVTTPLDKSAEVAQPQAVPGMPGPGGPGMQMQMQMMGGMQLTPDQAARRAQFLNRRFNGGGGGFGGGRRGGFGGGGFGGGMMMAAPAPGG
jgi:hypothetical protein